jgi:hypothetical protein
MALLSTDPLDIRLDENWDLFIGPNGLELISGIDGVAQLIGIAIKLFLGEWFLNLKRGMPWFQEIFGGKYDEGLIRRRLSEAIANVPGVSEVLSLVISFDGETRAVSVEWEVRVKFDDTDPDTLAGETTAGGA